MFTVVRLEIGTRVTIEAILKPFSTNSEWINEANDSGTMLRILGAQGNFPVP
jgi:hypothetical protein